MTLVEYGDYECPHCGHAYPIVKRGPEAPRATSCAFVFRNFPLDEHASRTPKQRPRRPKSPAPRARFWEMHDALFEHQERSRRRLLSIRAKPWGSTPPRSKQSSRIKRFAASASAKTSSGGVRSGVNGTPTFFING